MLSGDTKKRFLFSLGLLVIIWVVVGSFAWIINSKKKETGELISSIALKSSRKNEIKSLATKLLDLNDKIEKTNEFLLLPGQDTLVKFIEKIEYLGETSGVKLEIDSIEVTPNSEESLAKKYEELNLKLNASGSFKQMFHFASLIENLPYHVNIEEVDLKWNLEGEEEEKKSVWRGDFTFKVSKLI